MVNLGISDLAGPNPSLIPKGRREGGGEGIRGVLIAALFLKPRASQRR